MREGVGEQGMKAPSLKVEALCGEVFHQEILGNKLEFPHALYRRGGT